MDIMSILGHIARTTITFIILLILCRLLGKKQVSQLTFFNYISGITIGSIASNIVSESNVPFHDEFTGLIWWCLLTFAIGYIDIKSGKFRQLIEGKPSILICKSVIDEKELRSNQLSIDDLLMMMREKSIFSVLDIEYAILEANGQLSILKNPDLLNATKGDMKVPLPSSDYLPIEIVVDGKVITKNLTAFNLDEKWLNMQMKKQDIRTYKDIFYAELQGDGSLYIQKQQDTP